MTKIYRTTLSEVRKLIKEQRGKKLRRFTVYFWQKIPYKATVMASDFKSAVKAWMAGGGEDAEEVDSIGEDQEPEMTEVYDPDNEIMWDKTGKVMDLEKED
jgi:Ni,Fe-hydrogenase I large subunit